MLMPPPVQNAMQSSEPATPETPRPGMWDRIKRIFFRDENWRKYTPDVSTDTTGKRPDVAEEKLGKTESIT